MAGGKLPQETEGALMALHHAHRGTAKAQPLCYYLAANKSLPRPVLARLTARMMAENLTPDDPAALRISPA